MSAGRPRVGAAAAAFLLGVALAPAAAAQTCYVRPFDRVGDPWHCLEACDRSIPHAGVDFPVPRGSAVPAIADGVASVPPYSDCLGNVLVIAHPDGMFSGYAHLQTIHVVDGQAVTRGQHVADSGETGRSPDCVTGPHLHLTLGDHFESYRDRRTIDPLAYIDSHADCSCHHTAGLLSFSCNGPLEGQTCVSLNEPADPDTWTDNFICTAAPEGLVFSASGEVEGMECVALTEPSDSQSAAWDDNFVCLPPDAPFELAWSFAGALDGWSCVKFDEPSEERTWRDNFLCERKRLCFEGGGLTFCHRGTVEGEHCLPVNEPLDDQAIWADNTLCVSEKLGGGALGLQWSAAGPIAGMDCTAVTEPAESEAAAWSDNFVCLPPGAPIRLEWSAQGPLADAVGCARWYEAADLDDGWADDYLCVYPRSPPPPPDAARDAGATYDAAIGPALRNNGARGVAGESAGCDCATTGDASPAAAWPLAALVFGLRSRRRRVMTRRSCSAGRAGRGRETGRGSGGCGSGARACPDH